jgi:hypothetical protein
VPVSIKRESVRMEGGDGDGDGDGMELERGKNLQANYIAIFHQGGCIDMKLSGNLHDQP